MVPQLLKTRKRGTLTDGNPSRTFRVTLRLLEGQFVGLGEFVEAAQTEERQETL